MDVDDKRVVGSTDRTSAHAADRVLAVSERAELALPARLAARLRSTISAAHLGGGSLSLGPAIFGVAGGPTRLESLWVGPTPEGSTGARYS